MFATVAFAVLVTELLVLQGFGAILQQAVARDLSILAPRIALFLAINGVMFLAHEGAHAPAEGVKRDSRRRCRAYSTVEHLTTYRWRD